MLWSASLAVIDRRYNSIRGTAHRIAGEVLRICALSLQHSKNARSRAENTMLSAVDAITGNSVACLAEADCARLLP